MSAIAAAAVLAGLVTAAGPAAAAGDAKCTPKIQVLDSIGDESYMRDMLRSQGVFDLGADGLAVGVSGHKPVYWTGTTLHPVPLADPNATGQVIAVNAHGLMVGMLRTSGGLSLFTYRVGDAAITPLPDSYGYDKEADVNDAGYVAYRSDGGVATVWKDGRKVRELSLPADAGPGMQTTMVTGINNHGDVLGMATQDYEVPETGEHVERTYPVLWPGDGTAARLLDPTMNESYVQDLDESGRVVGYDWAGPWHEYRTWVWEPPLGSPGSTPGGLSSHPYATFEAISPTTNVSVGTAKFHPDAMTLPDQALLRSGSGPVKALPRLAAGGASMAEAVSDTDLVGGAAVNAKGKLKPVIWTCATKQAYNPGS
ncbi:hypothetical protein AW27_001645 [Streptomyces sp. PCS3-D2]|uniref:hypothetical protein n=1 Tax=Streptomyces sp. PCS3-D2 TaxID=1460244 RepID=UPI000449B1B5|nr:hypothetical protein [Streptomyces sp. PCS3-D2]WKV70331.1 hypothetical protein AW27_001645 [Streptomyces sp. PCS3-D2]